MKSLKLKINEALKVKIEVSASEKKKVQRAIYKELEKNNTTGRFYHDEHWAGVAAVRKDIDNALYSLVRKTNHEYDCAIGAIDGGYRKSKDGMAQWKEYRIDIFIKGHEEPFMQGHLNCHAAGSIEDPFDTYDMTVMLYV